MPNHAQEIGPELGKDPLYRKHVTASATTYLLGYRSVFIRPNNNGGDTSFEKLLPKGTIVVDVPMVKDSPLQIIVYAENIVFVRGSKYLYSSKDLTISCRSATFVSHPTYSNVPITFDLSGEPVLSIPADPPVASSGETSTYAGWANGFSLRRYPGSNGIEGTDGAVGPPGGRFVFKGDLTLKPGSKDLLKIVTTGGKGSRGGRGGQGGVGGDGWGGTSGPMDIINFKRMLQVLPGTQGGEGGRAGRPGYGGSGGDVSIIWTANGQIPAKDGEFGKFENLFTVQADVGQNGEPGERGPGGPPGKNCQAIINSQWGTESAPPEPFVRIEIAPVNEISLWAWRTEPSLIPAGPVGSQGPEANGVAGAEPSPGQLTIVAGDATVLGLGDNSPRHLLMIIDRLSFEYFIHHSSQIYHPPESLYNGDITETPLGKTLFWISTILEHYTNQQNEDAGLDTLLWKGASNSLRTLCRRIYGESDIYDHGFTSVEQPHLGLWEVESILKDYIAITNQGQEVRGKLQEGAVNRLEIHVQLRGIAAQVTTELSKQSKAITDLEPLRQKIVAADALVTSKLQTLRDTLKGLEGAIRREVNCEYTDIISALGTVSLFFSPHAGTAHAIGALATMAVGAHKRYTASLESLPTELGGHIEKSYLYDCIDTLKENSTKLKDDLSDAFRRARGEKLKGGTSDGGLSIIRVQAEKFEHMSEEYLTKIKATGPVKVAYQEVIDAIQDKNDLLASYNETYLSISSSNSNIENYTKKAADLLGKTGDFADDELQLIDAFLTEACSDMGRMALRSLYNAGRTMNCASLSFSRVFTPLAALQSFSGLTAQVLHNAFKIYLVGQDVQNLNNVWTRFPSVGMDGSPPIVLALHHDEYPSIFGALYQKQQFTFPLDLKNSVKFGFSRDWWDVRLRALEVYLPGAVRIKGSNDDEKERPHINLRVSNFGKAAYLDKDGNTHKFDLPQIITPFRYTYPQNSAGDSDLIGSKPVGGDAFIFSLEPNHQRDYVIQSPFTAWTVSVSDETQVKVTDCKKIVFKFHLTYRARHPKK